MDDEIRWSALFADLQAASETDEVLDRDAELADRIVVERGRLRLIDRLRPALDSRAQEVVIATKGHPPLRGRPTGLGADWVSLAGARTQEWLVPLTAVTWIGGLGPAAAEPGWEGAVSARSSLRLPLRRLLREHATVTVATVDAGQMPGVITTVGSDHVELTRAGARADRLLVPTAAIAYLSRR